MKKEYELRGIDCGNCAAKIERAVNQLEQVESATVNLIAQKLILETKSEDGIDKEIIDLVDAIEPGIEVISEKKEEGTSRKTRLGERAATCCYDSICLRLFPARGVFLDSSGLLSDPIYHYRP